MGGLTLYGSLMIGMVLIIGHRLFPDSVVMWFASPQANMMAWREVIVVGLIAMAMVRQYYHNLMLQLLWAVSAAGLLWASGLYFLNNPSYVFDAMLMLSAGTACAITALLPNSDPINIRAILPKYAVAHHARQRALGSLASWQYMSDSNAPSHRLMIHMNK